MLYFTAPCKLGSDLTDELEVLFSETSPQSKRRKRTKIQEDQEVDDESDDDQQQSKILEMFVDVHFMVWGTVLNMFYMYMIR